MSKALLVVDVQNDFCPGGALEVPEGDRIVSYINRIRDDYDVVAFTQDWHPRNHVSFATNHEGHKPFDVIRLDGIEQTLWPDHCVPGTRGAEFHPDLDIRPGDPVFKKGFVPEIDSYSGFLDNDKQHETGLKDFLRDKGVHHVDVVGLAADVCVRFTVLDAHHFGFDVTVLREGTRGINTEPEAVQKNFQDMEAAGAHVR